MLPALPAFFDMVYTDLKNGKLASDGYLYNDQTFQILNAIVSLLNESLTSTVNGNTVTLDGINPPPKTTAQITALQPTAANGTLWYNSDLKKLQFKADTGVVETITST